MTRSITGLVTVGTVAAVVGLALTSFRGGLEDSVTVTVLSPRAGLVMNPDAKVQFHGVQVGKVAAIEDRPDGRAVLRLAMDPSRLQSIPANVIADIAATTVFGAKSVQLQLPPHPSAGSMYSGQVLDAGQVMIEINTVFEQLVSVLSTIQPEKLNQTLGAIAAATGGNGGQVGQMLVDLNSVLHQINPRIATVNQHLETLPQVLSSYADAAPALVTVADNATTISRTIVDQEHNLDAMLLGTIGLADVGEQVLQENRKPLTDTLAYLVPATDLTNQYHEALRCALKGITQMSTNPPLNEPGVEVLAGFMWGQERYRYPENLPKVAATGGPQCTDLPDVPYQKVPPFVVTDVGANPWKYNNPGIVLNSDGLKQILFGGPKDGPPRNSAQIGQPG
ncbi:MAG: MCE family protein [Mycobacterium sp.]|nr:MCE family protein [Mycobacterium sp.]